MYARRCLHQLGHTAHSAYQGDAAEWFRDFVSLDREHTRRKEGCWRAEEGIKKCHGRREDIQCLVVSLPVMLVLELGDESRSRELRWDFPPTLLPLTKHEADVDGIVYDLVGLALLSTPETDSGSEEENGFLHNPHFIARYASADHSKIYTYDGTFHNGFRVKEPASRFTQRCITCEAVHKPRKNSSLPEKKA